MLSAGLLAAGCSSKDLGILDANKWLNEQPGPKVEGVSDTLLKNAKDADNAGDYRTAAAYYQQLVDKNPDNKEYRTTLADTVRKLGETEKALAMYDAVLKLDPAFAPAVEGKGLALMQKGEFDAAQLLFNQLITAGKGSWRTYNAVGVIVASRQNMDAAKPYFDEALKVSPANPSVMNNLGLALGMNREFDPAIAQFTQASALASARPAFKRQIDLNAAMVYAAAGKLDNAEALARQYLDGAALSNNMGFYAHLAQDDQLARTYLNMALTQSKRFYPRAWENLQALNQPGQRSAPAAPVMPVLSEDSKPEKKDKKDKKQAKKGKAATEEKTVAIPAPVMPPTSIGVQAVALPHAAPPIPEPAEPEPVVISSGSTLPEMVIGTPEPTPVEPAPPVAAIPATPPALLPIVSASPAAGTSEPVAVAPAPLSAPATTANAPQPAPISAGTKKADNGFEAVGNWFGSMLDY